jgi:N-acetylmuramoyl-L-alanine amidase
VKVIQAIKGTTLIMLAALGWAGKAVAQKTAAALKASATVVVNGPSSSSADTITDGTTNTTAPLYNARLATEPSTSAGYSSIPVRDVYVPSGKYAKANLLYYKMIDSLTTVLREYPLLDSAGLNYATDWVGTPNMGLRRPNYVVIHHTATSNCTEALNEFARPGGREASAHYLIDKDGTVYHLLNDLLRSHHAGDSKWGNLTDLNSGSIGIELDNNGYQSFSEPQMNSLIILLERLKVAYKIPEANFIGHGDVAPSRKSDPNWRFPWKRLNEKGFGMWWGDTTNITVPENFDHIMALRIIGYDTKDADAAVRAFKRHFMQEEKGGMTPATRKILFALYRKYQ